MTRLLLLVSALAACATDDPVRAIDHVDTGGAECVDEYTRMYQFPSDACREYATRAAAPECSASGVAVLADLAYACAAGANALGDEAATGCVSRLPQRVCTQLFCAPMQNCTDGESYFDEETYECACI